MRKLAVFSSAFSAGIFLAQCLLSERWLLPGAVAAFVAACAALRCGGLWRRRLVLAGVGLSLALGYDWLYLRQVQRPMEALAGTERQVTMTVQDYAVPARYGTKVTVRLDGFRGKAVYYGDESLLELVPGQTVQTRVRVQSAARIREDDVTVFTSRGVFALAYGQGEAVYGAGSRQSARWWPARLGRAVRERITSRFSGEEAAFLCGILTGDKSALSQKTSIAMSQAGLYHILAVSGMHCMFLLSVVTGLLGRHRRRLVAAWGIPLMAFYALLTGGSPSVVRACVMVGFYLAAPLFRRDSDGPTALCGALLAILLANPFAAASVSLQLSFGAMAGLLWVTPKLRRLLFGGRKHGRLFNVIISGFSSTMGALVFTAPLSALYFNTLVLLSPLVNLLCLGAAGVLFLSGWLAVVLGGLPVAGPVLELAPRALTWYILQVTKLVSRIPYHALSFSNGYLKLWMVYAYGLFAAVYFFRRRRAALYAVSAVLSAAALALTVFAGALRYDAGRLHILALDVGQGQSILLASKGVFALVDCGSGTSWYDPGQIAADQLQSMGCQKLDYLILTHYDADHISGVAALLERLPAAVVLVPEGMDDAGGKEQVLAAARAHGAKVKDLSTLTQEPLGQGTLTVYPPLGAAEGNERGLSVLCSAGEFDLLVTGDMNAATEQLLLAEYPLPDLEVLVAGHHGSRRSTSQELLETLRPETAIISVGANSYGHPADETLRRLADSGAAVYRTDKQGTIHLTVN